MNISLGNNLEHAVEADRQNIWHQMSQHKAYETTDPWLVVEGSGMRVWDAIGQEYLDFTAGGVWTSNVGYGRKRIGEAMLAQLSKLQFFAGTAGSVPGAMFAERLLEKMPGMSRVYYATSGSEANEKVFKMVRQISALRHGGKKNKILFKEREYHGSTLGALAATGQAERFAQYGPLPEGFVQVPHCLEYRKQWDCADGAEYGRRAADAIEEVILREGPDTVGALCMEPITAGGGVIVPPEGYWPRVQEICQKYDILLHVDEVVCGLGRTGKWFGYQHFDIQPDFVTTAKGVASGYAAIGCAIASERVFDMFKATPEDPMAFFRDISTFGGCVGGPTAALENLAIIEEENLVENAAEMGDYLHTRLRELQDKHPSIGDVRGKGLLQGVELVADRATRTPVHESKTFAMVAETKKNGVLISMMNRAVPELNTTLCIAPALIVTRQNVDELYDAMDAALTTVFGAE
ncbi:aspartate aminotransferase family protein [Sulfitobacter pontiacus]|uniref:aminotransferase family protein n=1 Tax=Sulfitobacter pontiacus TaxID=60137 RepID=UPI003267E04E